MSVGDPPFRLRVPPGWSALDSVPSAAACVLVEDGPPPPSGFRANVVVTVEPVPETAGVELYTDASLARQEQELVAYRTLDRTPEQIGDTPGTRTLGHHALEEAAITIEQWRLVADGLGWTVTASCATLDFPALAGVLAGCAESFAPGTAA